LDKGKKRGNTAETVYNLVKPLADQFNLEIWDVVYLKEGADWYLRVFIDKETGVSINDCVDLTQELNPVLDKADPVPNEYILEVSSPGINRKLTRPEHYRKYIGQMLRVKLVRPLEDGRRLLDGVLLNAESSGSFAIQIDEETSVDFEKKEYASVILLEEDFNE